MSYKYSMNLKAKHVKVLGRNLPISRKKSIELGKFIKGLSLDKAKNVLRQVIDKKVAVPFTRYNRDTPHRSGNIASGRYPVKAAKYFLKLVDSLINNAKELGYDGKSMVIKFVVVNKGTTVYAYGRHSGRKKKRTHVEMIAVPISDQEKSGGKKVSEKTK